MHKIYKVLVVLLVLTIGVFTLCACNDADTDAGEVKYAQVYVTTGTMSKLMMRETSLEFVDYDDSSYNTMVTVDVENKHQNFYGYGASLTHSSAYLLMQEGAEEVRKEMLNELFGADGARFNFVRVPIGASDYIEGSEFFSCCDLANTEDEDMELKAFNLDHDKNIIAVLKEIVAINPDVNVIAVPWSAPAWMKTSKKLTSGSLEEKYESVFADYLVKFINEYKKEGIAVTYVSLVNEPLMSYSTYPMMFMDGYQAARIIKDLGPKLENLDHDVKIMSWDHNVNNLGWYLEELYGDQEAYKYIAGTAFHGYSGDYTVACDELLELYPDKELYLTEITEHSGSNDFARNLAYAAQNVTIAPVNKGSSAGMFWNYVLRSDGTPTPVYHSNVCYGVMDMNIVDGEFVYNKNSAYYAMAHISKFAYKVNGEEVKALRAESSNDAMIVACALYRADGAIIVSVCNLSDVLSENVDVVIGGKSITFNVQPQSIVTFVC